VVVGLQVQIVQQHQHQEEQVLMGTQLNVVQVVAVEVQKHQQP
jgi:hypothetical protein